MNWTRPCRVKSGDLNINSYRTSGESLTQSQNYDTAPESQLLSMMYWPTNKNDFAETHKSHRNCHPDGEECKMVRQT